MFKKIVLSLLFFFLPLSLQAEEISFSDLKAECFTKYSLIGDAGAGVFKASLPVTEPVFFVQDGAFLPHKTYQSSADEDVRYNVASVEGADKWQQNARFLQDGNPQSGMSFDPYNRVAKSIIIDAGRELSSGSFVFEMNYAGRVRPKISVSRDNESYIQVANPENFDVRYIKILFEDTNAKTGNSENIFVKEISLTVPGNSTLLINSPAAGKIDAYSGYKCASEKFQQAIVLVSGKSANTAFPIDINTKTIPVVWQDNIYYNKDFDSDGIENDEDNCPYLSNADQKDTDGDLIGEVCDFDNYSKNPLDRDSDKDGIGDSLDNCPFVFNPRQEDVNSDKRGDACMDDDRDGFVGHKDNCPNVGNPGQEDVNVNGIGDACEFDADGDLIFDSVDNCIRKANPDQADRDNDGIGDACDNCKIYNPRQTDKNRDSVGDECEEAEKYKEQNDEDEDGILNGSDNCRKVANPGQEDRDQDGVGDACDNCPEIRNADQTDKNKNGTGDMCEDSDADGIVGYLDNCMHHANAGQEDRDNDKTGDACEDDDNDGVPAMEDNCPEDKNPDQRDVDKDKIGDACDKKDDRMIESNTTLFTVFIVIVSLVFGALIVVMLRKIKKDGMVK